MKKPYNDLPLLSPKIDDVIIDPKVIKKVLSTNKELAKLNGIEQMNDSKISQIFLNSLILTESIGSNHIENINTDIDKVSISKSINNASGDEKETLKYRDAVLLGMELLKKKQGIITINDIVNIQETIEENESGIRTVEGTCLKDNNGNIVYYPPEPLYLGNLLNNLEQYINYDGMHDIDDCIKSAIIHHQFESIHPFYDGNGRTGRILILLYLIKQKLINFPVLFISGYLNQNKGDYYKYLDEVRTKNNWKGYILYMLDAIEVQAKKTSSQILEINKLYRKKKEDIFNNLKMDNKELLLDLLFQNIYISQTELIEKLEISKPTLGKKLLELENNGILQKKKEGKFMIYFFEDYVDILKK